MPTYDYECTKCGHSFDAFQSMSDDPLVKCPGCGKNGLKRLIGGGLGLIFKGSGFYVTDSRTGGNGRGGSSNGGSESTSSTPASGDSSSSDSNSGSSKSESAKTGSSSSDSKTSKASKGSKAAS